MSTIIHKIKTLTSQKYYISATNPEYNGENESEELLDYHRYRSLFRAVILQALLDASYIPGHSHLKYRFYSEAKEDNISQSGRARRERELIQAKAIAWFNKNNGDFKLVCEFADLNPEVVLMKASKIIKQVKVVEKKVSMRKRRGTYKKKEQAEPNNIVPIIPTLVKHYSFKTLAN